MFPDLVAFGNWLLSIILYVPEKVYQSITDGMVAVIDYVFSLCSFCSFTSINSAFAGLPNAVLYFLDLFEYGWGVTVVSVAYLARFALRRIPGIG